MKEAKLFKLDASRKAHEVAYAGYTTARADALAALGAAGRADAGRAALTALDAYAASRTADYNAARDSVFADPRRAPAAGRAGPSTVRHSGSARDNLRTTREALVNPGLVNPDMVDADRDVRDALANTTQARTALAPDAAFKSFTGARTVYISSCNAVRDAIRTLVDSQPFVSADLAETVRGFNAALDAEALNTTRDEAIAIALAAYTSPKPQ